MEAEAARVVAQASDVVVDAQAFGHPGGNCIKIGLPGKLILSKRKGLREILFC